MAWYVKVRKENLNGEEIMLQRHHIPLVIAIILVCTPVIGWFILWALNRVGCWRKWRLMNNDLYETEQKIAKKVKEIEDLLEERKILKSTLKQEKKEISDSKRCRSGFSEPWYLKVNLRDKLFFRRYPDLDPPDGSWRKMFDKKFLDDKPKPTGIRERMGVDEHPMNSGNVTAYTLPELKQGKSLAIVEDTPWDDVMEFKEDNKQKGGGKSKSWRKRRPNETPEEHEERLRLYDKGEWVEDD